MTTTLEVATRSVASDFADAVGTRTVQRNMIRSLDEKVFEKDAAVFRSYGSSGGSGS